MLDTVELAGKDHCTLGRAPTNDLTLDHPSSSRLHAVIQFRGRDGAAFVYDPSSTHGTFLNKKRIPAGEHVQLRYACTVLNLYSNCTYAAGLHRMAGPRLCAGCLVHWLLSTEGVLRATAMQMRLPCLPAFWLWHACQPACT